jgi:hypothetical protein
MTDLLTRAADLSVRLFGQAQRVKAIRILAIVTCRVQPTNRFQHLLNANVYASQQSCLRTTY